MFGKSIGFKGVLLAGFVTAALLSGCADSSWHIEYIAGADEKDEAAALPGDAESESLETGAADYTAKEEAAENTKEESSGTLQTEADEISAEQPETNGDGGKKKIYEGLYFDESFYRYVDMPQEESPLVYCEIVISGVTDTSFDFVISEKVMATGESSVLVPTRTAAIEEGGSKAVYEGDGLALTFSFPDDEDTFPQHLEVSGLEKTENKSYINNTIPGHESG